MTGHKSLRPTTGKVRGAIFDILRKEISGASFLDLYAGTGNVGIDALKQGASLAVLVEESKGASKRITENAKKLGLSEKARVISKKTLPFIEWAELNQLSFDIIFLDPPYHTDEIELALSAIARSAILNENGRVIAEHFKKRELPAILGPLEKERDYHYGDTVLSIYVRSKDLP